MHGAAKEVLTVWNFKTLFEEVVKHSEHSIETFVIEELAEGIASVQKSHEYIHYSESTLSLKATYVYVIIRSKLQLFVEKFMSSISKKVVQIYFI